MVLLAASICLGIRRGGKFCHVRVFHTQVEQGFGGFEAQQAAA
jgi:hypothetical protein